MNLRWHGWLGLGIMVGAQILLVAGSGFVATWLTPIMWTGYILLADALIARRTGRSWLTNHRREFGFLAVLSVLSWLIFEFYNFKLKNWHYINMPPEAWVRDMGFFWSFATITPAIFETAGLLEAYLVYPKAPSQAAGAQHPVEAAGRRQIGPAVATLSVVAGLALIGIPPALPDSMAPSTFAAVWVGFILVLEPINCRLNLPSLLREWLDGRGYKIWVWLAAGFICGLVWEAWNVQALAFGGAGWIYTMPAWIHNLVFGLHYGQMPLAGLLGFPPFAMECFAIYYFLRWALFLRPWLSAGG